MRKIKLGFEDMNRNIFLSIEETLGFCHFCVTRPSNCKQIEV